ncbi:Zn-ribbon domain-containing OB-fold protein [Halobacillus andaensis]|uniref:Zn-ribbon domain-containing OB-fold protein n=1 Tax=Halobacillus andaensis TaxID=1176239 RepID=UPI003D739AEB
MEFTVKHCPHCEKTLSTDKYYCTVCFSEDLQLKSISGKGEVYSYTLIHAAPEPHADESPYYIILVDLEEGLRVTARYSGGSVEIGEKVELESIGERAYYFKIRL